MKKWNLFRNDNLLQPLKFSNGKTQEDVVGEVLNLIEKGNKIIFVHGVCGTGKSAIALNIANNLGKSCIIVPGKNLQAQYKKDYEGEKYLQKDNGEKLKINVITGRNNHPCKFLEDNKRAIPTIKREINSKLNDIFEPSEEQKENRSEDLTADNRELPCKIEIKEKNFKKLKEYLRQNPNVDPTNFLDIKDIKRISVAAACPYWCPVIPDSYEIGGEFKQAKKYKYEGMDKTNFVVYERRPGCSFYGQFKNYVDSDVLVFNSLKYKLEMALKRKPKTEVEIVDECDEFLDSFSNQRTINLERLYNSLNYILPENEEISSFLADLNFILREIKTDRKIESAIYSKQIIQIKETKILGLIKCFLANKDALYQMDEENYVNEVQETANMFSNFLDETYVIFNKRDKETSVSLITTNLAKKFKEMVDKNKSIVLMSGTLHSEKVLKEIFGLNNFEIVEAEVNQQGTIEIMKTGFEKDCKYQNFLQGKHTREDYLKALNECIKKAPRPTLVHVNGFHDLPSEEEIERFELKDMVSRNDLKESQKEDKEGKMVEDFKKKKTDILFSTRSTRGVDFPGDECRSIIFTKYPNPDVQDPFWRILKQTHPNNYWEFYKDKAKRELLQRVYRGLRFKEDHVFLLSPDSRVLQEFE